MWQQQRARVLTIVRWGLAAQLGVGTVVVLAQRPAPLEQTIAVQEQAFTDRVAAIEGRLKRLEDLDAGTRLAVLEKIATDGHDTKLLVIGAIVALCGNLVLGLVDRRLVKR